MIPSLLQIPSAVSDSKLHSVLPNNGKGDFQFDRSTGATRINRDGLIEEVGYFSSELVQNGNFSELGSEIIPDPNFDTDSTSYWSIASTGGTPRATKSYIDTFEGKFMRLTYDLANGAAINRGGAIVSGKSYRVTFRAKGTANSAFASVGNNGDLGTVISNPTLTTSFQNYEFYITATQTTFRLYLSTSAVNIGDTLDIDNISVKQVDPNDRWTLGTGWVYGANKISNTGGANFSDATQSNSNIIIGNTYKVSYTISNYTSGSIKFIMNNNSATGVERNANGNYVDIIVPNSQGYSIRTQGSGFVGDISNISVVEVQGDRPRLSYDITNGVVEDKPHLLLEPSSTNLVTFSNDYTQSTWNKLNFTANSETSLAPDGTTINGYNFGDGYLFMNLATMVNSASYTSSVYIKANKNGTIGLRKGGAGSAVEYTNINLTTSWQRFTSTSTATVANNGRFLLDNRTVNGFGVSDLKVFVYGAQNEQQSYATSFIPTAGTTITRAAETCNNSKPSVNSTEGVLYCEIAALSLNDDTFREITLNNGTLNDVVELRYNNVDNQIQFVIRDGGSVTVNSQVAFSDVLEYNKMAFQYKANDFKVFANGLEVATDTAGSVPSGLNQLDFSWNETNKFYGKVKGLAVYNEALSESQLFQLTGVTASSIYNNFVTRTASFTVEALNEVKKVIDNL